MKYKVFQDLYHQEFMFFPGTTEDFYEQTIRKANPRYSVNLTGIHGNTTRDDQYIYIWVRSTSDLGVLVHECIHAANYCLSDRGIKADAVNDEPTAYLAQWLFDKFKRHMKGR